MRLWGRCSVDLWCLGITIYNMVYGVTPFEAPEGAPNWQQITVDNIMNKKLRFLDNRKVRAERGAQRCAALLTCSRSNAAALWRWRHGRGLPSNALR